MLRASYDKSEEYEGCAENSETSEEYEGCAETPERVKNTKAVPKLRLAQNGFPRAARYAERIAAQRHQMLKGSNRGRSSSSTY